MGLWQKIRGQFDLSKTEDRLKLFILVSGLLIFLIIVSVGGISLTMKPGFCKVCHKAMQPEYVTWEVSSHSQISCVECHMEKGVVNILIEKVGATKHLFEYVTAGYEEERPIKMKHEIPAERCEFCHSKNREYTVSGDLIVPHEKHAEKGIACVKCHSGVAHGNIAGRGATAKGDLSAWTVKDARREMTTKNVRPDMDVCIACHMERQVTFKCEACHSTIFTPDNHKTSDWTPAGVHGKEAQKNLDSCNSCHSYGVTLNSVSTGNKTIDYAWGNSFCVGCHSKLPPNHANKEEWGPNHKNTVGQKGMDNCKACHSLKAPPEGKENPAPAKNVYCNRCHWFK